MALNRSRGFYSKNAVVNDSNLCRSSSRAMVRSNKFCVFLKCFLFFIKVGFDLAVS